MLGPLFNYRKAFRALMLVVLHGAAYSEIVIEAPLPPDVPVYTVWRGTDCRVMTVCQDSPAGAPRLQVTLTFGEPPQDYTYYVENTLECAEIHIRGKVIIMFTIQPDERIGFVAYSLVDGTPFKEPMISGQPYDSDLAKERVFQNEEYRVNTFHAPIEKDLDAYVSMEITTKKTGAATRLTLEQVENCRELHFLGQRFVCIVDNSGGKGQRVVVYDVPSERILCEQSAMRPTFAPNGTWLIYNDLVPHFTPYPDNIVSWWGLDIGGETFEPRRLFPEQRSDTDIPIQMDGRHYALLSRALWADDSSRAVFFAVPVLEGEDIWNGDPELIVLTFVSDLYTPLVSQYPVNVMDCVIPETPRSEVRFQPSLLRWIDKRCEILEGELGDAKYWKTRRMRISLNGHAVAVDAREQ